MSWDEKIACAVNGVVGAVCGSGIFLGGLALAGRSGSWWNGWLGFLLCVAVGFGVGVVSYYYRHCEFTPRMDGNYEGAAGGWLLARRIGVILGGAVAFYFLWQLARGV